MTTIRTALALAALLATVLLATALPVRAGSCDDLVDKVSGATHAEVTERTDDFARFKAGDAGGATGKTTLSLSCGGGYPSSVGVQFRGETPAEAFYALFGQAGNAVTGIAADVLTEAAHRAEAEARSKRHSNVEAGGALVTCSFSKNDLGPLAMCAVIEKADRS